jgi:nucleoside-diphosphate-sugar epimerase
MSAMKKQKRTLVTGAGGAVGHFLVDELLRIGHKVVALDLPRAHIPAKEGVEVIEGDVSDDTVIEKAVDGVQAIVHAAAIVDIALSFEKLAPVNYEATKKLFLKAKEKGVQLFLFFSTGSAYPGGLEPMTEDTPLTIANDYVRSKVMSEEFLKAQASPPIVNILRPALIYGPWGKVLASSLATTPALLKLLGGNAVLISGGPKSNWVHSEDVARAACFLVENPQPHGEAFNVAGDETISVMDMFAIGFETGSIKVHRLPIPYPLAVVRALRPLIGKDSFLLPINKVASLLYSLVALSKGIKSPLRPRLDKEALEFAVKDMVFDNSKLKKLGFRYKFPSFKEGWQDTYAWYKANRWIP